MCLRHLQPLALDNLAATTLFIVRKHDVPVHVKGSWCSYYAITMNSKRDRLYTVRVVVGIKS